MSPKKRMRSRASSTILCCAFVNLLGWSFTAIAEIEKGGNPCETGICVYWWPKLPAISGWHHEAEASQHHAVNALAPDGSTFENAETVMYAVALYKPRMTEIASVDALIADDKKKFIEQSAAVSIDETKPLATGDGQKLRSFTFFPKSEGNWEQVAYGEEGDYYLIFTVSSRTKSGYAKALQSYEAMLRGYKAKL
jgi:hypothetical protein